MALAVFLLTFVGAGGALFFLIPPEERGKGNFQSVASVVSAVADVAVSPDLAFGGRDHLTIVIIGRDVDRDRRGQVMNTYGRSDTIMVAYLDRYAHKVSMLSVPRDTLMRIPPRGGVMLVNAAHSLGGPERLIDTLRDNLCLDIDHWVRVNFEGSVKIIDAMGGVVVDVEKDMKYDDNWGHLHINLKEGRQLLDGDKAHQYMRFRKDKEGDIGRIRRQQQLMRAVARQLLQPNKLTKLPKILSAIQEVVDTDLTDSQVMSLAAYLRKVPSHAITTECLPGYARNGHWLMATGSAEDVLKETMGRAFGYARWRRVAKGRYAGIPVPAKPVADPKPVEVAESGPDTSESEPTPDVPPAVADLLSEPVATPVRDTAVTPVGDGPGGTGTEATEPTGSATPEVGASTQPEVPPLGGQTPPAADPASPGGGDAGTVTAPVSTPGAGGLTAPGSQAAPHRPTPAAGKAAPPVKVTPGLGGTKAVPPSPTLAPVTTPAPAAEEGD